jgi:aconitate hydratase
VLVFRSNVPAIAEFCFRNVDTEFVARARAAGRGIIVGGEHYGQGSSREAAVMGPMHLGVRAVIAKSFARIHRANLINWGVLPLELADPADYDAIAAGDRLRIASVTDGLASGTLVVQDETAGRRVVARCVLTDRERAILLAGGRLAHTRVHGGEDA